MAKTTITYILNSNYNSAETGFYYAGQEIDEATYKKLSVVFGSDFASLKEAEKPANKIMTKADVETKKPSGQEI